MYSKTNRLAGKSDIFVFYARFIGNYAFSTGYPTPLYKSN